MHHVQLLVSLRTALGSIHAANSSWSSTPTHKPSREHTLLKACPRRATLPHQGARRHSEHQGIVPETLRSVAYPLDEFADVSRIARDTVAEERITAVLATKPALNSRIPTIHCYELGDKISSQKLKTLKTPRRNQRALRVPTPDPPEINSRALTHANHSQRVSRKKVRTCYEYHGPYVRKTSREVLPPFRPGAVRELTVPFSTPRISIPAICFNTE